MAKLIEITGKPISGEWGTDDLNGTGIPVLRTTNFTNEGNVDYSNVVLRQIAKKNISDKMLRYGDIILEKSGGSDKQPVGRVIFFEGEENKYLFNNFTGLLRIKDNAKWLPKYVFYALYANYIVGGTLKYENRTTGLHNLQTDSYVSSVEIQDRSIEEQHKIADTLDKISDLIAKRRKQLEKLDMLVKSRFIELFGGIHDSMQYPYVTIESFTSVMSGGTPDRGTPAYWQEGNIRWVKTTELQNCVITDTEEKITQVGMDNSSAKLIPVDSVLIAMYGQGKTRGMTGYTAVECTTNQACACILPSETVNQKYLWQYMILSYDKLRDMAKGGNQPNLNVGIIKKFPVLMPPLELQEQFASFVDKVDKSKSAVQNSLEKLEILKKSLMQKYFG